MFSWFGTFVQVEHKALSHRNVTLINAQVSNSLGPVGKLKIIWQIYIDMH